MSLLLLFNSGGGSGKPKAFRQERRGKAQPTRGHRALADHGFLSNRRFDAPSYLSPILLDGYAPPGVEEVWVEGYGGAITAVIVGGGGGPAAQMFEFEHEERLNEYEQLRFTIPATLQDGTSNPKADLLDADVRLLWRNRRFRISAREEVRDGIQTSIAVEAEGLWLDLADKKQSGDYLVETKTPFDGLKQILSSTDWAVGTVPADTNTYTLSKTDASVMELVRGWATLTGYEVAWNTFDLKVSLVAQQGSNKGVGFRYGRNLLSIKRRVEPPKATRLWAYGRDAIDITGQGAGLPYVTDYSYYTGQGLSADEAAARYTKDFVWNTDIVAESDLYTRALAEIAIRAQPVISYEMKVIDLLAVAGAGDMTFSIGDTVAVRDAPLGLDITTRVVRLIRRPLEPWRNEIELSVLQKATSESSTSKSVPGTSDWVLYIEENSDAQVLSGATEYELAFFPRFLFLDARGEYEGNAQVPATLSGSGVLRLRLIDIINSNAEVATASWSFNSATFSTWTYLLHWRAKGLTGKQRLKVMGSITSGAGTATIGDGLAKSDILVRGLLTGTDPPLDHSATFDTPGTYFWSPPDGVETAVFTVRGAKGGYESGHSSGGAAGGMMKVRAAVVPGESITITVGAAGIPLTGGTPGGGGGADGVSGDGGGGGGYSAVARNAGALIDSFVLAGGGGGDGTSGAGGAGGYPTGTAASGGGGGGTQTAGGGGGSGTSNNGTAGSAGQGGTGGVGIHLGGGGGGWYGGGGGGGGAAADGGGGGGSGYYDPAQDVVLLENTTGENAGTGSVIVEW